MGFRYETNKYRKTNQITNFRVDYVSWCIQKVSENLSEIWNEAILLFRENTWSIGVENQVQNLQHGGYCDNKSRESISRCGQFAVTINTPDWNDHPICPIDWSIPAVFLTCCNMRYPPIWEVTRRIKLCCMRVCVNNVGDLVAATLDRVEADGTSVWKSGPVRFLAYFWKDRDWDRSIDTLECQKTRLDRF